MNREAKKKKLQLKRKRNAQLKILKKLKLKNPAMFRKCGDTPCCQAYTDKNVLCTRPAMTTASYIKTIKCCYLCWQHASMYGVYGLAKISQLALESRLSWDEYCFLYPEKCMKYFESK